VTPHSAKPTWLSWASSLGVPEFERLVQGHHKPSEKAMVLLYSRDDVGPQLRLQVRVLLALANGWRPGQVHFRGGVSLASDSSVTCLNSVPACLLGLLPERWEVSPTTIAAAAKADPGLKEALSLGSDLEFLSDSEAESLDSASESEVAQMDDWAKCPGLKLIMKSRNVVHAGVGGAPACGASLARDTEFCDSDWEDDCEVGVKLAPCRHVACRSRLR
jgi:hypothetical protein